MRQKPITVKQDEAKPVATEILAESIVTIAAGMQKILNGSLGDNALVLLIQDACGGRGRISQEDVRLVLESAAALEELYVRKRKGKGR